MKGYFDGKKMKVDNPNVPKNAELIGIKVFDGGMICDFYCLRYNPAHELYGRWALWMVSRDEWDEPHMTNFNEMDELGITFYYAK